MNVLVTGGLGYLGAHAVERFAARGDEVRILDLGGPAADQVSWAERFEVRAGDIADASSIAGCCAGADLVVHAAALNQPRSGDDPALALRVNALGTRNLLAEAAGAGVSRFLYMSTIHAYGVLAGAVDEGLPPRPITDYGVTKLAGEGYCHEFAQAGCLESAVLRPANGFGPPVHASADCWMLAVNDFCRSAHRTGEIVLKTPGTQQRVFVALTDVVSAIEILATAPPFAADGGAPVFNVGSAQSISIRGLASQVAEVCSEVYGRPVEVRLPEGTEDLPEEPTVYYHYDPLATLDYHPHADLRGGIREVAEFVAASGG